MMSRLRSALGPVLLALLLVTAGCTGNSGGTDTATPADASSPTPDEAPPQAESTPTDSDDTTPTDSDQSSSVEPSGPPEKLDISDHYDVDANRTFTRVMQYLNGDDWEPQPAMIPNVTVSSELIDRANSGNTATRPFPAALGLANESGRPFTIGGYTTGSGTDVVIPPNLSTANVTTVLAHEFVHVDQSWSDWETVNNKRVVESPGYSIRGYDRLLASEMLTEGSAEYVEQWYAQQYVPNGTRFDSIDQLIEYADRRYRNASGHLQYRGAPYYYGLKYFDDQVGETQAIPDLGMDYGRERPAPDEPWSVTDVYRFSGGTTERLLHPDAGNESLRIPDLTVRNESVPLTERGTAGELFTRLALAQELAYDRAVEAAEGWGTDKIRRVNVSGTAGWLWVSRWDSADDAAEFASAMGEFGDAHPSSVTANTFTLRGETVENDTVPASVTVERPTDDTVVTYIGDTSLPKIIDIAVSDGGATVTVETSQGR